jgi:rhodanese-related sulfurtransferase
MLEFRANPESGHHDPVFQKDETALLHCASGGCSTLAGKTLQDRGYMAVFNISASRT